MHTPSLQCSGAVGADVVGPLMVSGEAAGSLVEGGADVGFGWDGDGGSEGACCLIGLRGSAGPGA